MEYNLDDFNNECENCSCYNCRENGNSCFNCENCSGNNASKNAKFQNNQWKLECNNHLN